MVVEHKRIYRGEVRKAYPTWRNPDPAEHAASDPHDFLKTWMHESYPYPEGFYGMGKTSTGQHWTRSPEIIPERFAVDNREISNPQPGVPMGKQEQTAISRREFVETAHLHEPKYPEHPSYDNFPPYPGRDAPPEEHEAYQRFSEEHMKRTDAHWAAVHAVDQQREQHAGTVRKYETYLDRAAREGRNTYADLSNPSGRPGEARPFNMAVIWEAHHPEPHEYDPGTNYEDELDLPLGSHARVTGARLYIPKSGMAHDFKQRHPSVFTPEEHDAAKLDMWSRSSYSALSPHSSVPWSRVQFGEHIEMPIERPRGGWSK